MRLLLSVVVTLSPRSYLVTASAWQKQWATVSAKLKRCVDSFKAD